MTDPHVVTDQLNAPKISVSLFYQIRLKRRQKILHLQVNSLCATGLFHHISPKGPLVELILPTYQYTGGLRLSCEVKLHVR